MRSTPIVYDPELYVLKHTKAPAVLLENGFHTNREEAALLGQADYRPEAGGGRGQGNSGVFGHPLGGDRRRDGLPGRSQGRRGLADGKRHHAGKCGGRPDVGPAADRRQFAVLEYRIAKLEGFV